MHTQEEQLKFDAGHIWHPYSSATNPSPTFLVERCEGVTIELADGRQLIDGMSSWWCTVHGYNHPRLNQAMTEQIAKMSHVMFGGFTHNPAVELSRRLVDLTPQGLERVFLADSGSVSVEVAIKMAIQYQASRGKPQKHRIMTVRNGYHGDTFGAMATCDPVTGMHHLFQQSMPQQLFADAPPLGFERAFQPSDLDSVRDLLAHHAGDTAAFIIEPITQGAGGMRFYSPDYLAALAELCKANDVLLIADEIATGFGRTGKLFAVEHAGICPDILCLGKALTGGTMTLAATLCTAEVANGISHGEAGVFMHGPTFMGNPLACRVACESIDLLIENDWSNQVSEIEKTLIEELSPLSDNDSVATIRVLGAMGVIEMKHPVDLNEIQPLLVEQGVWLRPFGKLIYMMPPFVITKTELQQLCRATATVIEQLQQQ
ncbi:adenosylmethionine--8-amino-7-oxononanoate transaminase [uncultured Umboniibacter sp.]|uniref:adenosylmethionine--8-amino-7-oxononanoate transaminase n=1 Tax=uncultured Umboniibacter sp. TaxID=1798917 RepID=UPI00261B086C|nr:adenosylmethionine--8-amino-7-oxononanoate transaminase [uncultured Umboniibacter sp.]